MILFFIFAFIAFICRAQNSTRADSLFLRIINKPELKKFYSDTARTFFLITNSIDSTEKLFFNGRQIAIYSQHASKKIKEETYVFSFDVSLSGKKITADLHYYENHCSCMPNGKRMVTYSAIYRYNKKKKVLEEKKSEIHSYP